MKSIVIIVRGCPIGCLGAYGNEWIATPNIDGLAAEGTVYDRHYSDCPEPLAARRAWWGLDGPDDAPKYLIRAHRAVHDAPPEYYAGWAGVFDARPGANPADALDALLPEVLAELTAHADWRLVIELDRLLPPWHVPKELFAVYVEDLHEAEAPTRKRDPGYEDDEEPAPPPEVEGIEPWADPLTGWFDRDDFPSWELLHRTFATVVTGLDAELGWLFERFREHGLDATADWLITSDFGYPLGEHGIVGPYRPWLHEEFVHLPLIVRRAGGADAGRRIEAITQPMDFRAILRGDVLPVREAAITRLEIGGGGAEIARRTATDAILLPLIVPEDDDPREPKFYLKPDDRWEANDVRSEFLDRAEAIEAELQKNGVG